MYTVVLSVLLELLPPPLFAVCARTARTCPRKDYLAVTVDFRILSVLT